MEPPFKVGGLVAPPYFADRMHDLEVLERSARSLDQHFLILAPRRFGKTSLLLNLRQRLAAERSLLVPYVNCRDIVGPEDVYRLITRALLEELERKRRLTGIWTRFRTVFTEGIMRAMRTLDGLGGEIGEWGKVYLQFREQEIDKNGLVRAAFSFPSRVAAEHQVGVVFLLDEFQEVAQFDGYIFSVLKKEMDQAGDVRYFFSGSSLGLIKEIFLREEAPLYLMVTRYRLGPLPPAEALEFLRERFVAGGLTADQEALEHLYSLTDGIPFYLQKLGLILFQRELLTRTGRVNTRCVEAAFGQMLAELDGEFEVRWLSRFSPLQRRILRALAHLAPARVTDIANQLGTKPSDISSSLGRLREAMVVEKTKNAYRIVDTVFARWIRSL